MKSFLVAASLALASSTVYFKETFEDGWDKRWTVGSEWKSASEMGEWKWTGGKYPGAEGDKGIQTSQDARFYSLTAPFEKPLDNKDKTLVLAYTVKHEQDLDCGGAYIKLMPGGFNPKKFGGDTPYSIMFGPDVCGYTTRKTHAIFNYKGDNKLTKKNIRCETDRLSHRYTLIVNPDNTYEVQIDGNKVESGNISEDWDMLPPKTIKDPNASKPADWVDEAQIPDPTATKPEGWDDIPAKITDPSATKPDDWDDDEDGEWTAPLIDNPEYKGEWKAPMIPNPAYKGPWVHPEIPNPDYFEDDELYHVCHECNAVGFELWQVKSGTIIDDIIVTDSLAEANEFAQQTYEAKKATERKLFDEMEEAKRKEEERKAKEAEAARAAEKADEDDEDEDDEKDEL